MDSIRVDTFDIKKFTDTINGFYERIKQSMETSRKELFSSMAELNLSAINQLAETMRESIGKWGSVYAKYDYSDGCLYFESCEETNNWHSRNLEYLFQSGNLRFYR